MRTEALEQIKLNIRHHGHHIYRVAGGGPLPRYVYSIGLKERIGLEVVLAGASFYFADAVEEVVNEIANKIQSVKLQKSTILTTHGSFSLRSVHESWANRLFLGAKDYYQTEAIGALQIVPAEEYWTADIPDMSIAWSPDADPVWKWLEVSWPYAVPASSTATTDLAALRGETVTEMVRWEEDQWEIFAGPGPEITEDQARVVPLGTLIGIDASLEIATTLAIEEGLWRSEVGEEWNQWGKSA